jgi:two-component system sensor histidine kinase UhpB
LSNAVRHGNPSTIEIDVKTHTDGSIGIRVVDDGGGLKASDRPSGFGIMGMQERVASLGGTLEVKDRSDGQGVIVSARLPVHTGERIERTAKAPQEITLQ